MQPPDSQGFDIVTLARRAAHEIDRDNWENLHGLYHPEVEITTLSDPDRVHRGIEGLREWWAQKQSALIYQVTTDVVKPLSPRAAYISGRMYAQVAEGGIADRPYARVLVAKDGLIWRYRPVRDEEEAMDVVRALDAMDAG